ncbi:DUF2155 domain-containing protein [Komagataeibacter oboediens]|uniref:DUF2155 domain-containing protein n=1 Tax=Komagataeibacter oboediens TaxID=65958 RepID=A0A318QRT0_9PROT|nr:DUF2155 domain-containing protein [Komagataeibacter oboediens]MBV0888682.1 DUF2155 domain-containing protein [Komagataeibacter oboediens]MBV1824251.1 DUF2155 domain-containing protein [Komagataeibacter oboediens]MCK9821398.1 DUF2155 domain-containing protein [Komagataeibacter oboediens]PYD82276.1 hypothetical protein CFR80_07325 [Komagataeibacter oboediens]WEQ53284.1 DUF2155 domain-containing protein [Komagataeibacter oboediens]
MRRLLRCLPAVLLSGLPACAHAVEWLAPPAMYPPDTWQGRSIATVRVLDKLDAHIQMLDIPTGQDVTYKSLTLHATSCLQRPPTLPADSAAWMEVHDAHEGMAAFQGWMAIDEPATGVFQNPLYDVQLAGCSGDAVAPVPPPLATVAAPGVGADGSPVPAAGGTAPSPAPGTAVPDAPQPMSPTQAPTVAPPASPPLPTPPAPDPGDEGAAPLMLH